MRIVHTSDWHLGLDFYGMSLEDEQRAALCEIARIVQEQRADLLLVAGDVYDRSVVSPEAIALYDEAMRHFCLTLRVPVVICAGNHDGAARLSALSALLAPMGLHVVGKPSAGCHAIDFDGCRVHVLPHFSVDQARALYPTEAEDIRGVNDACRALLKNADLAPDKPNLLLAHLFVAGGETQAGSSDRAAVVGGSGKVDASLFEGFDYVALGHLHRPQWVGERIRYSGTPYPYSLSEAGQEKSVTLYDTESRACAVIPIPRQRDVRVLAGTYEDLLGGTPSQDYLRLDITDRAVDAQVLDHLRVLYPFAVEVRGASQAAEMAGALTREEIGVISPLEVMRRFMQERGREADSRHERWFLDAVEETGEEES